MKDSIVKFLSELPSIHTTQQAAAMTAAGIGGVVITYSFGSWSELLSFFLIAIGVDYFSGLTASLMEGKGLSSSVGFKGLAKKLFMVVVIALAHRADILLGTTWVMTGAIYFYLSNELISITENYGRMNLPLPNTIRQMIAVLKQKGESNDGKGL